MAMGTTPSFFGGGGGSFGGGGAFGNSGGQSNFGGGYSSGLLNQNGGFGSRGPAAFGSTGMMETMQNGLDYANASHNAQLQSSLQAQQNAAETQRAHIQARAETLGARLGQQRFQEVFPYLQHALGQFSTNPYTIGGGTPPQPTINAGPVWSQQQTNEQINNQQAQNTASTASNIRNTQQQLAGRGFGANSPLAMALAGQQQAANQANNSNLATQTRFGTAQANAQQLLSGQQAQEGQWNDLQQAQVARAKPYFELTGQLLSALGGLGR